MDITSILGQHRVEMRLWISSFLLLPLLEVHAYSLKTSAQWTNFGAHTVLERPEMMQRPAAPNPGELVGPARKPAWTAPYSIGKHDWDDGSHPGSVFWLFSLSSTPCIAGVPQQTGYWRPTIFLPFPPNYRFNIPYARQLEAFDINTLLFFWKDNGCCTPFQSMYYGNGASSCTRSRGILVNVFSRVYLSL